MWAMSLPSWSPGCLRNRTPRAHPLFPVINFLLDRQTAVDGGAFWDAWKTRCLAAIDTALDDALECLGED
jgi:hypothetical protein